MADWMADRTGLLCAVNEHQNMLIMPSALVLVMKGTI
jgi:hypothetical protein